ncbi:coiled-coil domain-containing protein 47, partial [Elysia marginata]
MPSGHYFVPDIKIETPENMIVCKWSGTSLWRAMKCKNLMKIKKKRKMKILCTSRKANHKAVETSLSIASAFNMKAIWFLLFALFCLSVSYAGNKKHDAFVEDNDFAEFEEFEDEEDGIVNDENEDDIQESVKQPVESDEMQEFDEDQEEEEDEDPLGDDEFEHLHDEEEFENFDREKDAPKSKSSEKLPDLQMAKVPLHLRTSWDSFYLEMLMIAGLTVYFLNFLAGKNKNCKLATAWLSAHKELLETQFSIVELKLLKRQDLINLLLRIFKPASDQVIVKVELDEGKMDNFVFCVAQKRSAAKLHKDMNDL